MSGKAKNPLNVHVRFNAKNPLHVKSAKVLDAVPIKYKSAFLAVTIDSFIAANYPDGVDMDELMMMLTMVQKKPGWVPKPRVSVANPPRDNPDMPSAPAATKPPGDVPPLPGEAPGVSDAIAAGFSAFGVD